MAVVDVQNINGEKISQVDLDDGIFNIDVKKSVLHEVVTMQLAGRRSGTASVKRRSDIRGSGRKLFRQKGTGRARRGNIKAPLLRGGGVTFGPSPKSYSYKVPKKVRRLALKMALSSKFQGNEIVVLDKLELKEIKTKRVYEIIEGLKIEKPLIVIAEKNDELVLSARNLPNVKILKSEGLNVYDILNCRRLVLLESSIKAIEGRLSA